MKKDNRNDDHKIHEVHAAHGTDHTGHEMMFRWLYNANRQGTPFSQSPPPEKREQANIPETKRVCSHCGAGLQEEWTHCLQCGAPADS